MLGATCPPEENPSHAAQASTTDDLDALVVTCRACPRLVAWREQAGRERRASYRDEEYWARPVPSFGPADAGVMLVGLAPAAHGSNRTGRMFTGDKSGDFLFAALHRTGFANHSTSEARDDGLEVDNLRMAAPVRCAPPENKPTREERLTCAPYLARELELVRPRVIVTLGAFGWAAVLDVLTSGGWAVPRPRPKFGHGAEVVVAQGPGGVGGPDSREVPPGGDAVPGSRKRPGGWEGDAQSVTLLGCYHPSPHNTFTGRLTPDGLDALLLRARDLAD